MKERVTIAILALGGQGGGVLADWILDLGRIGGWRTQGTSVPGVAQRTGATIYYIEFARPDGQREPVMALMPVPGDVDIVIASELMEAGRAMLRGFVSRDRTVLITSTHRVYTIAEKTVPGDGIANREHVLATARERAQQFVGFDMDGAAVQSGSVISSVMFGALAGSGALPFRREEFERVIRDSGIAVEANLRGFATGVAGCDTLAEEAGDQIVVPRPTTPAGCDLAERVECEVPASAQTIALHGVARLMDYQDAAYADFYLKRLARFPNPVVAAAVARHLALWMSWEDTIRVADLKIRADRFRRVRDEVRAGRDQIISIDEFMHPRTEELCETMPALLGRWCLNHSSIRRAIDWLFVRGRTVRTSALSGYLLLRTLAALRRVRRSTLRYKIEDARIEAWLGNIETVQGESPEFAAALAECQRLVKGYGDTFERGLSKFGRIMAATEALPRDAAAAEQVRKLIQAALADEEGAALDQAEAALVNVKRMTATR